MFRALSSSNASPRGYPNLQLMLKYSANCERTINRHLSCVRAPLTDLNRSTAWANAGQASLLGLWAFGFTKKQSRSPASTLLRSRVWYNCYAEVAFYPRHQSQRKCTWPEMLVISKMYKMHSFCSSFSIIFWDLLPLIISSQYLKTFSLKTLSPILINYECCQLRFNG